MHVSARFLLTITMSIVALATTAALPVATSGRATAHVIHPGPDRPDPYVGLRRPLEPDVSCCHGIHCGVATPCRTADGKDGWIEGATCVPLDDRKRVYPPPSFWHMVDAPFHVCRSFVNGNPVLYCWMRADVF